MTDKAELARKVMEKAVAELIDAGCHHAQIVEAMAEQTETLREQMSQANLEHGGPR